MRTKPRCHVCGSDRVSVQADAIWNEEKQDWDCMTVMEEFAFCHSCEAEFINTQIGDSYVQSVVTRH